MQSFPLLCLFLVAAPANVTVTDLRCESLVDPLGIDCLQPRLSWVLTSDQRNQWQTAYQVLVAGSVADLAADKGDLWDSGKVSSDASIQVPYAGRRPVSRTACYWKVRVWDAHDQPSAWSTPAHWTMGLLDGADWQAKWIAGRQPPKPTQPDPLETAQWIWTPSTAGSPAPSATAHFRLTFELPRDDEVRAAELVVTADDNYQLFVNGEAAGRNRGLESWMRPDRIDLRPWLRAGKNVIGVRCGNHFTPESAGLLARLQIRGRSRLLVDRATDGQWKASERGPAGWMKTDFDDRNWSAPRVIGAWGVEPWGRVPTDPQPPAPSPLLRKAFSLDRPVRRATITVCGLGYYELRLNGRKVGDHELDPAFTRYDRRMLYATYEVGDRLRPGSNVLGVMLGNGWYNEHTRSAWNFDYAPWRGQPRLLLQIDAELADGRSLRVATDESWKTTDGPIVFDGIRLGESYDARQEKPGWDTAEYDDSGWTGVRMVATPNGKLAAQMLPPIRMIQTVKPVKVTQPRPGVFVFDLGWNITGRAKIRVAGQAGTQVTLRYGERLATDGMVDQREIAEHVYQPGFQTDHYTLRGGGIESWASRFVYHGFQYVEVTGWPGRPSLSDIEGQVLHTDLEQIGRFECSDPTINRIELSAVRSYLGNFHGYPTDCPHREKNGWTGDAHLAADMGLLHFRGEAAYTKWLEDIADEQRPDGSIAAIVPTAGWGYLWGNGPAWDSAYLLIADNLYRYRGDQQILRRHYAGMRRYVDYLTSKADHGIVSIGLGDWAPWKTKTPVEITSTAYYYRDTQIVAAAAELLGKTEEAAHYRRQAAGISAAFAQRFPMEVLERSQTGLACALYQGLAPASASSKFVDRLVKLVDTADGHLDAGILGTKYLLHALSDGGRSDVAWRVATQKTPPGWGDWMEQGATTLWEQWNGSASRNHIMFGDVSAWWIRNVAGITLLDNHPGFKRFALRPRPMAGLAWAGAEHRSPYGPIRCSWRREGRNLVVDVMVPVNTTALVYLPTRSPDEVREGQQPALATCKYVGREGGCAVFAVGSGTYRFGFGT